MHQNIFPMTEYIELSNERVCELVAKVNFDQPHINGGAYIKGYQNIKKETDEHFILKCQKSLEINVRCIPELLIYCNQNSEEQLREHCLKQLDQN